MSLTFDWTISLGNLLTVLGFCVSGIAFVSMMRTDLKLVGQRIGQVENRVSTMEEAFRDLNRTMAIVAGTQAKALEMDKRIDAISRRVDEFVLTAVKR